MMKTSLVLVATLLLCCSSTSENVSNAGGASGGGGSAGASGGTSGGGTGGGAGVAGSTTGGAAGTGTGATGGAAGAAGSVAVNGLVLWLDATKGVQTSGTAVTSWQDQSASLKHAQQAVAGQRPVLVDVGGKPRVQFDGLDDRLNFASGFSDFTSGLTLFAVASPGAFACMQLIQFSNGQDVNDISLHVEPPLSLSYEIDESFTITGDGAVAQNVTALIEVRHEPPTHASILVNGVLAKSDTTKLLPSKIDRKLGSVGSGEYNPSTCKPWLGNVSEILLYNRDLTEPETTAIQQYLQNKWGCCKN